MFTTINDKNGNEIYGSIPINGELNKGGDIVKYVKECWDWDKPDGQERYEKDIIGRVIFVNGEFKHEHSWFGNEGEQLISLRECEIIGNQYNNPELLENKAERNNKWQK